MIRKLPIISASSNQPVFLTDPEKVWRVTNGPIDIFAVPTSDGRPSDRRHYLFRVESQDLIFGAENARISTREELALIAVGAADAGLEELVPTQIQQLSDQELVLAVEKWVSSLSNTMTENEQIWPERTVPPEGEFSLPAGEKLYGRSKRPLWVRGDEELSLQNYKQPLTDRRLHCLPLVSNTWLRSEKNLTLTVMTSNELFNRGELLYQLHTFQQLVQVNLVAKLDGEYRLLDQQLVDKEVTEQRLLHEGYSSLHHSLLAASQLSPEVETGLRDNALLTACQHIANYWGEPLDRSVTEEIAGQAGEMELTTLLRRLRLRGRRVILRGEWWQKDNGSLLGFSKQNEPLAILPVSPGSYRWINTVTNDSGLVDAEFTLSMMEYAHTLYRPLPDKLANLWAIWRFASAGLGQDLRAVMWMGLGVGVLSLILPIATGLLFEEIVPRAATEQLAQMALALFAATIGITGFQLVRTVALLRLNGRLEWSLQAAVFDRLLRLPIAFFKRYSTGDLGDRVLGIQEIRQILSATVLTAIVSILFSVLTVGLLFYYSWLLAIAGLLMLTFAISVTVLMSRWQLKFERQHVQARGLVEGLVFQLIIGASKMQIADASDRGLAAWAMRFAEQKSHYIKARRQAIRQSVFQSVFPELASLVIFISIFTLSGAGSPQSGLLSVGQFLAFYAAFGQLLAAITALASSITGALAVVPLYERSKPILDNEPESIGQSGAFSSLRGAIEIAQVCFRYDNGPLVLNDISLNIDVGEFVAVVGASGSGKSTLLRLLLAFEKAEQGEIFFDGKALTTLNSNNLRNQIGVVLQSGRINAGTIYENIVGASKHSLEDAMHAARLVGLDQEIEAMPMGMHTMLNEGAETLSGGQRQRLMIARALINKPRLLILDEATSALDNKTQAVVIGTLAQLNITRIIVAHRLSTVSQVDRIVVMDEGRVVEQGSYPELMKLNGTFSQSVKRQLV